jgi:hypothetical protein
LQSFIKLRQAQKGREAKRTQGDTGQAASADHAPPRTRDRDVVAHHDELDILKSSGLGHEFGETKVEIVAGIWRSDQP